MTNPERRPLNPNAMREEVSPDEIGPDLQDPNDSILTPDEPTAMPSPVPKKRFPVFNRGGGMSAGGMGGYGGATGGYGGYGGGKQVGQERTEIETQRYTLITKLGLWGAGLVALLAVVIVFPAVAVWTVLSLKSGHLQDASVLGSFFGHLAQVIATIFTSSS